MRLNERRRAFPAAAFGAGGAAAGATPPPCRASQGAAGKTRRGPPMRGSPESAAPVTPPYVGSTYTLTNAHSTNLEDVYKQGCATGVVQDIRREISAVLEGIDQVMPMAFLLKRDTRSSQLDSFRLKPVGNQLNNKLRFKMKEVLKNIADEKTAIKDFDREYESDKITVMDVKGSLFVEKTLKTVFEMADSNPIDSLKNMKGVAYSSVLFKMPNHRSVIAIDTVAVYHKGFRKIGHLLSYGESINDVESIILFKFDLPCIYFEKINKLLVLDRKSTEGMFNLIEHYQGKIKDYFEKLTSDSRVDIDVRNVGEWTKKITMARRVNSVIQNGLLDRDPDVYEKYREYLDKHPDINDDELQLSIKNGRICIPDKKHFESFLNFAESNLQQSVIDPDDVYVAMRKRKVKRI